MNEKSVEEIQKWMGLGKGQAVEKFEEIKHDLYGILHIEEAQAVVSQIPNIQRSKRLLKCSTVVG